MRTWRLLCGHLRWFAAFVLLGISPQPLGASCGTIVTSLADDGGQCTLRTIIADAAPDTAISFAPALFSGGARTLVLDPARSALTLTRNATIAGPGATMLAIDGANATTVLQVNSGVTATISGATIQHGAATAYGGGIINLGTLTLRTVAVDANTATTQGGGIVNGGTLVIERSTVSRNTAGTDGGGISNASGVVTITDSTISGNTAANHGGGIFNNDRLTLTGGTVTANHVTGTTSDGGGLSLTGVSGGTQATTITRTIIAGNTTGQSDPDIHYDYPVTTGGHNLVGIVVLSQSPFIDPTDRAGSVGSPIDAKLGTLADHGGGTRTHAPAADSPARDMGGTCMASSTDQRGMSRPQGTACDIGAYEYVPFALTSLSLTGCATDGGATVIVTGTGLLPDTTVFFDTSPATGIVYLDSTRLRIVTPPHSAGTVAVEIRLGDDRSSMVAAFRYGTVVPAPPVRPSPPAGTVSTPIPAPPQRPAATAPPNATPNVVPPRR